MTGIQKDSLNYISTYQSGNGSTADFDQSNSYQQAYNFQYGTDVLVAKQSGGTGNYLMNVQADVATATITQTGTGNRSTGSQSGGWGSYTNTAVVAQSGNYNESVYAQTGANNNLNLTQNGNYNTSNLTQTGNNNIAMVQQN